MTHYLLQPRSFDHDLIDIKSDQPLGQCFSKKAKCLANFHCFKDILHVKVQSGPVSSRFKENSITFYIGLNLSQLNDWIFDVEQTVITFMDS